MIIFKDLNPFIGMIKPILRHPVSLLVIITIISKLIGFAREVILAYYFGAGKDYDIFMDEVTGWLPPEYHDLAEKMSRLSKRERYQLIDNLLEEERIDDYQHEELVRLFIDDIPDYYFYDGNLKAFFDKADKIHPVTPF